MMRATSSNVDGEAASVGVLVMVVGTKEVAAGGGLVFVMFLRPPPEGLTYYILIKEHRYGHVV